MKAGNAGLGAAPGPPPAWRGFRPLRVSRKVRESGDVISLLLEPTDGQPIAATLPGQFVVLRLGPPSGPALTRSYSLSGEPGASHYRVSVKRKPTAQPAPMSVTGLRSAISCRPARRGAVSHYDRAIRPLCC